MPLKKILERLKLCWNVINLRPFSMVEHYKYLIRVFCKAWKHHLIALKSQPIVSNCRYSMLLVIHLRWFRALSVIWTTPLVATLGMSLTIPIAMVADMVIHGRHYSPIYIFGCIQVVASLFIFHAMLCQHLVSPSKAYWMFHTICCY